MRKKMISLFLTFLMCCMTFGGCKKNVGTSEDNAIASEEESEEQVSYKFGFSAITMENPYFITLEQALRESVESVGSTMITKDPALDVNLQIQQIDEMIEEGIDAIFLCPVEWEEITPALERLKDADVRIINIDSEVKEMDYVDAFIGSNNYDAGYICGEDLVKQCPDGGKVVILESPTQNSVNDRIKGFEQAVADKGFEVVARMDTQGDLNMAREAANQIFEDHKDITAVMCGNDQIALGALVAAHTLDLNDIMIYGVDGSPDLKKELLKPGSLIRGTSGQSPINVGKTAVKTAFAILNGEKYEETTYEDVFFIDAENVEMFGVDGWQ